MLNQKELNNPENVDKVSALILAGVFNVESGTIEINVNNGKIQNIYIRQRTYIRSKE